MGNCLGSSEVKEPMLVGRASKVRDGAALAEDYRVLGDILGYGRVATVREGVDRKTGARVAIKACSKKVLEARPARISRVSEVEALLKVWEGPPCEHIVRLFATYEDANYLYLVTELARGGDLWHYLASKETFSEADAAVIGRQLLVAVQHCHEHGVVHRDLKPENILLDSRPDAEEGGGSFTIKLVDFGSAAIARPGEVLADFMATPFYAAPEVWAHAYGREADLWSVGAILYVLVTGLPPVLNRQSVRSHDTWQALQAGRVVGLPESTSPALADLLAGLLEPDPARRLTPGAALAHPWVTGSAPRGTDNLEGSIRGIRAFLGVRKFQKAAIVLLAVVATDRELRAVTRALRAASPGGLGSRAPGDPGGGGGGVSEARLEELLTSLGMAAHAAALRNLRERMLGPGAAVSIDFGFDEFLEILEGRRLAQKHLHPQRAAGGCDDNGGGDMSSSSGSAQGDSRGQLAASPGPSSSARLGLAPPRLGRLQEQRRAPPGSFPRARSEQNLAAPSWSKTEGEEIMLLGGGGGGGALLLQGAPNPAAPGGGLPSKRRSGAGASSSLSVHGETLYKNLMKLKP